MPNWWQRIHQAELEKPVRDKLEDVFFSWLLLRLPNHSREALESRMYIETDIKKTKGYQSIFAEGEAKGVLKGVLKGTRETLLSLYERGLIDKKVYEAEMQQQKNTNT